MNDESFGWRETGRLILDAVAWLHANGFELLRVLPAVSPSGGHWRVQVGVGLGGPVPPPHVLLYSSAQGTRIDDKVITEAWEAEDLAKYFYFLFGEAARGTDPAYAAWFREMVRAVETTGDLPVAGAANVGAGWKVGGTPVPTPPDAPVPPTPPAPINLGALAPTQLLELYARIVKELLGRKIIRTRNAPVGDYAELLVAEHFGGELAKASVKSYDVDTHLGTIQVKARVIQKGDRRAHQFSAFRSFDCDHCLFITFDADTYQVSRAIMLPPVSVEAVGKKSAWVNAHVVNLNQIAAAADGVDVTRELQATQKRVDMLGTDGRGGQNA